MELNQWPLLDTTQMKQTDVDADSQEFIEHRMALSQLKYIYFVIHL